MNCGQSSLGFLYIRNMNKFTFIVSVCAALFFAACGDDSSSATSSSDYSSSSVVKSSSSVIHISSSAMLVLVDPSTVVIDFITDSRDGQSYKTVTIGSQTWMAQNLNYETANSYCYNDSTKYCEKYGRLYTWAAAMDSAGSWSTNGKGCGFKKTCSLTNPVRGACPTDWHLPKIAEFETLFIAVGGKSTAGKILKSTSGWYQGHNGSNAYSFSALPAGDSNYNEDYDGEGHYAVFWSSTEYSSDYAYRMYLDYDIDNVGLYYYFKSNGFSVRCVKD